MIKISKIITVEEIKSFIDIINSKKLISEYTLNSDRFNKEEMLRIVNQSFPLLFTEEEIEEYFYEKLLEVQKDEEMWIRINKKELCKYIGLSDGNLFRKNKVIIIFECAYEKLLEGDFYPTTFKNKIIEKIESNEPLSEEWKEFEIKYVSKKYFNLCEYLRDIILPEIGEDVFCNYLQKTMGKFVDSLAIKNIQTINNQILLKYLFGTYINLNEKIFEKRNKDKYDEPLEGSSIYILILKELFEYTLPCYYIKRNRDRIYKLLEFDEEKIKEYEKRYKNTDRGSHLRYASASGTYNEQEVTVEGYTMKELYSIFDNYVKNIMEEKRMYPSYTDIMKEIAKDFDSKNNKKIWWKVFLRSDSNSLMHEYYNKKVAEAKIYWFKNNKKELFSGKDILVLYYYKEKYHSVTIDLTEVDESDLKEQLLRYINFLIKDTTKNEKDIRALNARTVGFIKFIMNKYEIYDIRDIETWHILSFINELDVVRHLKPSGLKDYVQSIRNFFKYFTEQEELLKRNEALNIHISHIETHQIPTPVIPDDILVFLDKNIEKIIRKDVGLIYRLLSETGWRFGDIKKLKIDNIIKESIDSDFATIKVLTNKTKKERIKARLGSWIEDNISIELYNDLIKYIEETKGLREKYNTEYIFFYVSDNEVNFIRALNFNDTINNFLKENNIVSINENYYNFSARQTRKTVASNLISNGASLSSVQKKLGHIRTRTTAEYYAEVNKKRISELNHEFYKEKFGVFIDEERLKLFTEEERNILYIDFCSTKRNTELGKCSRHPSEGRCIHLGQKSCAACPKLCTGKAYLEQWQKLMNDSYDLLIQFENKYKELNILEEEYQNYIEYKQEKRLYEQYKAVVESILKGDK